MSCPDDTELAGFLNDALAADRGVRVSGHVDGCRHCQARLDRLTEPGAAAGRPAFAGLPHVPGFDVLGELARAGRGVVYKARHRRLNRLVALKIVFAGAAADPAAVQRFLLTSEEVARIGHPQVAAVFEVGTYDGPSGVAVPYVATELLDGGSLADRLRAAGRLPPRAAAELVEGLARAVHAAHLRGVVHGRVTPANVLFGGRGRSPSDMTTFGLDDLRPKVIDFGLSNFAGAASPAADVSGLGALLFECLTGRPPVAGAPVVGVPLELVAVVERCFAREPAARFASAEALADDLRRYRGARRRWGGRFVAAVLAVAAVAVALARRWRPRRK